MMLHQYRIVGIREHLSCFDQRQRPIISLEFWGLRRNWHYLRGSGDISGCHRFQVAFNLNINSSLHHVLKGIKYTMSTGPDLKDTRFDSNFLSRNMSQHILTLARWHRETTSVTSQLSFLFFCRFFDLTLSFLYFNDSFDVRGVVLLVSPASIGAECVVTILQFWLHYNYRDIVLIATRRQMISTRGQS